MTTTLDFMTALDLRRLIATRAVSPVELTERALARRRGEPGHAEPFCLLMRTGPAAARRAEDAVMRVPPSGCSTGCRFR